GLSAAGRFAVERTDLRQWSAPAPAPGVVSGRGWPETGRDGIPADEDAVRIRADDLSFGRTSASDARSDRSRCRPDVRCQPAVERAPGDRGRTPDRGIRPVLVGRSGSARRLSWPGRGGIFAGDPDRGW